MNSRRRVFLVCLKKKNSILKWELKYLFKKKLVSRDDGPSTALNIDILILRKNISFVGWRINWVKGLDGLR